MYWWSNIAVPEEKGRRILVPASEAITFRNWGVYKVPVPMVDGADISIMKIFPLQWIISSTFRMARQNTLRMRTPPVTACCICPRTGCVPESCFPGDTDLPLGTGRNSFPDGNGRYVEIQAGLGKTQYGCIPMAPHTAWEWLERYGALQLSEKQLSLSFEKARDSLTEQIRESAVYQPMRGLLRDTKAMAKQEAQTVWKGSGFGAMKNRERALLEEKPISLHLDYGEPDEGQKRWLAFLGNRRPA